MRFSHRLISIAVLTALSGALGGCSGLGNWDPTDMFDFLDTKKKLPGDRRPVFPEGVPGLEQGVPKQMYRGANEAPPEAAAAAPVEPEAKGKRGKQKRDAAAARPAAPAASNGEQSAEEEGGTAAAPPAPKQAKTSRRRITTPPADDQSAAQSQSRFQAPVPSGSFQR